MLRVAHGGIGHAGGAPASARSHGPHRRRGRAGFAVAAPAPLQNFDFLFPELQDDPDKLLKTGRLTVRRLRELGRRMADPGPTDPGDSDVPAIYTYFGQFVDHDITFKQTSLDLDKLLAGKLAALSPATIRDDLKNTRNASLELDSVYGAAAVRDPANNDLMKIGKVSATGETGIPFRRPAGKGDDNDLPWTGRNPKAELDRAAQIGDPRNDENLIVSQLHLAFLKAHNRLVNQGRDFAGARRVVRQHYQHIVIQDFPEACRRPALVDGILAGGNRFYDAEDEPFFLPLEFTVTAFRSGIPWSATSTTTTSTSPTPTCSCCSPSPPSAASWASSTPCPRTGSSGGSASSAPAAGGTRPAGSTPSCPTGCSTCRRSKASRTTKRGRTATGANLAICNLLRGYALRLPTGQALAKRMNLPVLTAAQIKAAAASPEQAEVLTAGGFLDRTPLWYYLLAEAKHQGGNRLGPVGSNLVAEVLIGLVRRSDDSILRSPGWRWTLPSSQPDRFVLADLLRFARVAGGGASTKIYKVKRGDDLPGIAKAQLGDAKRWPEIQRLNRDVVPNPNVLAVGLDLVVVRD